MSSREQGAAAYPRTVRVLEHALGRWAGADAWPLPVWQRAWALGVGPTLVWLARAQGGTIPAEVARLESALAARAVLRRAAARQVLDALEGVPCLVLKGEPLAWSLYGDVRRRATGDLDLLIAPERIDQAASSLRSLGYVERYGLTRPEPLLVDEWGFVHPRTGQVVELHWAIAAPHVPSPPWGELWRDRRVVALQGVRYAVPSVAHELLVVCYHFHRHVGHLKGVLDVAGWLDKWGRGAAWGAACAQARELGAEGVIGWPQGAIGQICGIGPCGGVSGGLGGWSARVLAGCFDKPGRAGEDKTQGVSQAEIACWQALAGLALDGWERRVGAALHPFFYSPKVWAARRGSAEVGWQDWVRCGARPADLIFKQLKNAIFARQIA